MHCVSSLLLHTENAMEVAMNKLILATSMIGLALVTTQVEAGSHKNLKSKPPQTTQSRWTDEQATIFIMTQRPTRYVAPATNLRSTQPQTKPKLGHDTHEVSSWTFSFDKI